MVVVRMSRMPGPQQAMIEAPGATVWMAVVVPSISAHICVTVPARVIGAVAPENRHGVDPNRRSYAGKFGREVQEAAVHFERRSHGAENAYTRSGSEAREIAPYDLEDTPDGVNLGRAVHEH